jgi:hypothetical protein
MTRALSARLDGKSWAVLRAAQQINPSTRAESALSTNRNIPPGALPQDGARRLFCAEFDLAGLACLHLDQCSICLWRPHRPRIHPGSQVPSLPDNTCPCGRHREFSIYYGIVSRASDFLATRASRDRTCPEQRQGADLAFSVTATLGRAILGYRCSQLPRGADFQTIGAQTLWSISQY